MNSSHLWNKTEDWARYIAQDSDGRWYQYEYMPVLLENMWDSSQGRCEKIELDFPGWRDSLERRHLLLDKLKKDLVQKILDCDSEEQLNAALISAVVWGKYD